MSKLWIFGDSYSTPDYCVPASNSWWKLSADAMNLDVENLSWYGYSWDSVVHCLMCVRGEIATTDKIIVGVPPLERLTYFSPDTPPAIRVSYVDGVASESVNSSHNSLNEISLHQAGREAIERYNRSWAEATVLAQAILLTESFNNLLVVNLAEPFQGLTNLDLLKPVQLQALENSRIAVFENTYYSANLNLHQPVDFETHGWHGHHDEKGNSHWFETALLPKYKELNWL